MTKNYVWTKDGVTFSHVNNVDLPSNLAGVIASDVVRVQALGEPVDTGPLPATWGEVLSVDFPVASYKANGSVVAPTKAQLFTGGPGTNAAIDGTILEFAANVPPITNRGIRLEVTSKRLSANQITPMMDWIAQSGAVKNAYAGTFLGVFQNAVRLESGASAFSYLSCAAINNVTAGVPFAFQIYYKPGTSGRARIVLKNGANESRLNGVPGALAVLSSAGGTFSNIVETPLTELPGFYRVTGTFTPLATGTQLLGIGPDSATAGQDIIVLGGMMESNPTATSMITGLKATEVTRAAASLILSNPSYRGPVDVILTFYNGTRQVLSNMSFPITIDPTRLNSTVVKSIAMRPYKSIASFAADQGITFGSVIDASRMISDPVYSEIFFSEVRAMGGQGSLKMQSINYPGRNAASWDFSSMTVLRDKAAALGIPFRWHNFVWPTQINAWETALLTDATIGYTLLNESIAAVAAVIPDVTDIDVVNEVISPTANGYRLPTDPGGNPYYAAWGNENYIRDAFILARQYFPHATLRACEYGLENSPTKRTAFLAMCTWLKGLGLIDGVSLQTHLGLQITGYDWQTGYKTFLLALKALGLNVIISELDIGTDAGLTADAHDRASAALLSQMLPAYIQAGVGNYIATWGGIEDAFSDLVLNKPTVTQRGLLKHGLVEKDIWASGFKTGLLG